MSVTDREDAVRAAEGRRIAAMLAVDIESLRGLLHEDIVYAHGSARSDTREAYLEKVGSCAISYASGLSEISRIIIRDNVALVWARVSMDATIAGARQQIENAVLGVWVSSGVDWQMIAHHPTRVPVGS